jgi:hypothetical protein
MTKKFYYEALDSIGDPINGFIRAVNQEDAVRKIRNLGYFPTKLKDEKVVFDEKTRKEKKMMTRGKKEALWGLLIVTAIIGVIGFSGWLLGSKNPSTPAGHIGYVTQGAWFGEKKFLKIQKGPTSYGRIWLGDVINVPIMQFTFDEIFDDTSAVLSKDKNKIKFAVHTVMRVRHDKVKEFVELYSKGESNDNIVYYAYKEALSEFIRTRARDEIQQFEALAINENITQMSKSIAKQAEDLCADKPFEIIMIVVGNIQYPDNVTSANATYLATEILLKQKNVELDIAKKQKDIRLAEAEGIASAMEKINNKLTPAYLQYEAIKAQLAAVGSPNHTTVYIPVGNMGVPLVGALSQPDTDSPVNK